MRPMSDDLLLFAAQETVLISLHAYFSLCYSFFFLVERLISSGSSVQR